tara:strand:- start:155 stop:388 length:234 start_codon:yes stop_codon:yes gene_type:complete
MEQYNRDIERIKNIPFLEGNSNLEITTRGISDIVNSNNILETIKIMYCHNIISPAFRMIASTLITNLENDLEKYYKK